MVDFVLIGQLGLPDGVAGHENEALTWVGPGPQDYELAPANAASVNAAAITDSTTTGRAFIVAANAAAAQTALGASTVGKAVIVAADGTAARNAIGAGTSSLVLGTTAGTALAGDTAFTKTTVGLANVDNTSDANKPVSTATTTALALKEPTITAGTTAQFYRGDKSWQTLNKAAVGLSVVDNTADASKPVSTAQAAADAAVLAATVQLTGAQTVAGVKTFSSAPAVPDASFTTAKVSGLSTTLTNLTDAVDDLETSVAALTESAPSAVLIVRWEAGGYPEQDVTAPAGTILRWFRGPEAYDGDAWPNVDDQYTYVEAP